MTNPKPRKRTQTSRKAAATAKGGGSSPADTSRRNSEPPAQVSNDSAPASAAKLASELVPGDVIRLTMVSGADQAGARVEQAEPVTIGGVERVRLRLYGLTSGIRTTLTVRADAELGKVDPK